MEFPAYTLSTSSQNSSEMGSFSIASDGFAQQQYLLAATRGLSRPSIYAAATDSASRFSVASSSTSSSSYMSGSATGSVGGYSFDLSSGPSASAAVASAATDFLSKIEIAILRSNVPIEITETDEIEVLGYRGIWANKSEVISWRGPIPISQYEINQDTNPEIINKKVSQSIEYVQELAIRYLRPPTPPAPGEIIIRQEANITTPPAPPLIIRQQPPRPPTPEPLVIREAPPKPPAQVGRKLITISGKRIPPPPRKVIIERLPAIPSKPQSILIERWLPYRQQKRRVVFQANNISDPVVIKPKNVIVQWESPSVSIRKEYKNLGIIKADPAEYVRQYGSSLIISNKLPQYVLDIKAPNNLVLAANYQYNAIHELEGDLKALGLVDLDSEGLSQYRAQLIRLGITYLGSTSLSSFANTSTASHAGSSGLVVSRGSGASYGGSSGLVISGRSGASYGGSSGLIVSSESVSSSLSYGGSSGLYNLSGLLR